MEELFETIKKRISQVFLGDPVMETRLIHRDANGRFEIHVGLFRKGSKKAVWLKFIRKPWWWGKPSVGLGIRVRSFREFAEFLDQAGNAALSACCELREIPLISRLTLKVREGVHSSRFLSEYTEPEDSSVSFRLYAFTNRRGELRILFVNTDSEVHARETFDIEVLAALAKVVREHAEQELPESPLDGV